MPPIVNHYFIQHTVLNSVVENGRPLVNAEGKVVGITVITNDDNTPLYTHNIAVATVGGIFDLVIDFMNNYVDATKGSPLGLVIYWLDDELRQKLQNNNHYMEPHSELNGVLVWDVSDIFRQNIPDQQLQSYVVITHINGLPVQSMDDMYWAVRALRAGQRVTFSVNRPNNVFHMQPNAHLLAKLSACKTRLV